MDAVLFARKAVLSPTVQKAHIKDLEKGTAKYPTRPVDWKDYSIMQGAMTYKHENQFLGTLTKRLILWGIDNGNYSCEYPVNPLQPNVEIGSYIRSNANLFTATGKQAQDDLTRFNKIAIQGTPQMAVD